MCTRVVKNTEMLRITISEDAHVQQCWHTTSHSTAAERQAHSALVTSSWTPEQLLSSQDEASVHEEFQEVRRAPILRTSKYLTAISISPASAHVSISHLTISSYLIATLAVCFLKGVFLKNSNWENFEKLTDRHCGNLIYQLYLLIFFN